jgi:two-component sensor histidine kinase
MDSVVESPMLPESTLAMALILSSQSPLVLLDGDLEVIAASASFFRSFNLPPPLRLDGAKFADLGGGEWNFPPLMVLLRSIVAGSPVIEAYEMDLVRTAELTLRLLLSAHKLDFDAIDGKARIVLAISDVTAVRISEKKQSNLLREKQLLMQELQHRVANSLQIIASVLLRSARKVNSEETRSHLNDAHHRVMSIATLQKQLAIAQEGNVALRAYFTDLCGSIATSMIASTSHITLEADVDDSIVDSPVSVSLGLIVTELIINALKHAFTSSTRTGHILVSYRSSAAGWVLQVADDGIGFPTDAAASKPGLGTGIVEALAGQLAAEVKITDAHPGTRVSVSRS